MKPTALAGKLAFTFLLVAAGLGQTPHYRAEALGVCCFLHPQPGGSAWPAPSGGHAVQRRCNAPLACRGKTVSVGAPRSTVVHAGGSVGAPRSTVVHAGGSVGAPRSTVVHARRSNLLRTIACKVRSIIQDLLKWAIIMVAMLVIGIFSPQYCHATSCFACLRSIGGGFSQESSVVHLMASESDAESPASRCRDADPQETMWRFENGDATFSDEEAPYEEATCQDQDLQPENRGVRERLAGAISLSPFPSAVSQPYELRGLDDWIARVQTGGASTLCSSASIDGMLNQVLDRASNGPVRTGSDRAAPMAEDFDQFLDHAHMRDASRSISRRDSAFEALLDQICQLDAHDTHNDCNGQEAARRSYAAAGLAQHAPAERGDLDAAWHRSEGHGTDGYGEADDGDGDGDREVRGAREYGGRQDDGGMSVYSHVHCHPPLSSSSFRTPLARKDVRWAARLWQA